MNKNTPLEIIDTIIDPLGRYVFVNCRIFSEEWSLLNLYAPNYDDETFMQDIFLKIACGQHNVLVGGDFNFCLDPALDKSSKIITKSKAAKTTRNFMEGLNLMDVWRQLHPRTRDHSFYSCPHDSHTRIDLFLLSIHTFHRVLESEYLSRTLSDHSPLTLSILFFNIPRRPYRWRLNPTLLQRPDFGTFIREQIKFFCETNGASSPKCFILWDSLKAYLRGQIIAYTKGLKKYSEDTEKLEK